MRNLITGIMMCGLTACAAQTRSYESLSVEEFEKTLTESSVACLDVRTADEYADGHIANAFNADVREADFEKKVTAALPKSQTVALYCRSGNRSKKAAEILTTKGYKVVELNSGISGWTNAGKAVTKEEVDRFTTPSGTEVLMYCIKHGSLRMRVGDKWIYVDPVTKAVAPETDYSTMPKADYILITHEHQDHLDAEAIRQLTKEGTVLITNPRCKELLGGKGDAMKNGDSRKLQGGWKLEAVPAYKPKEIGFDRSMIGAYGHDDKVCAYPELMAILDIKNPRKTAVAILTDKEETGSDGNTGLASSYLKYFIEDIAETLGSKGRIVLSNSKCLRADVNSAFDPTFPGVFEKANSSFLNYGVVVTKFTGARGKSGTSDANAEYVAEIHHLFDNEGVIWQNGELGRVDLGGGGTVALYMANLNIDTIDVGVPVLAMHAPFEIVSKLDTYMAYKAFYVFQK